MCYSIYNILTLIPYLGLLYLIQNPGRWTARYCVIFVAEWYARDTFPKLEFLLIPRSGGLLKRDFVFLTPTRIVLARCFAFLS